jgi:hypothetical protein
VRRLRGPRARRRVATEGHRAPRADARPPRLGLAVRGPFAATRQGPRPRPDRRSLSAVTVGRTWTVLAERDRTDLIIVGAPHRAGAERLLGGDVAAGTLHGAPCAVAGFAERGRILGTIGVGFDDSAESRDALRPGGRVARAAGAALHASRSRPLRFPARGCRAGRGGHLRGHRRHAGHGAGTPQRRPRPASRGRGLACPRAGAPAAARQYLHTAGARGELPGARRPAPDRVGGRRRRSPGHVVEARCAPRACHPCLLAPRSDARTDHAGGTALASRALETARTAPRTSTSTAMALRSGRTSGARCAPARVAR